MIGTDLIGPALLTLAGSCGIYALHILSRAKVRRGRATISLSDLAQAAGYLEEKDNPRRTIIHIADLAPHWRNPVGYFSEDYRPKLRFERALEFFDEYIKHAPWFDKKKLLQRGIIAQILERYDAEHPCPSVVKNPLFREDHDTKWSQQSYQVLARVTLLDHVLDCASIVVAHLIEKEETWQIPRVLIAVLSHDLGKLPSALKNQDYATGIHPVISANMLRDIEGFDKLPNREDILKAIMTHHDKDSAQGLNFLVRYADQAARKLEYLEYASPQSVPEWMAPIKLPAPERIVNPHSRPTKKSEHEFYENLDDPQDYGEQAFSSQDHQVPVELGAECGQAAAQEEQSVPDLFKTLCPHTSVVTMEIPPEQTQVPAESAAAEKDSKWQDAIAIARSCSDISIKDFAERLRIGKARAQSMLNTLKEGGYFLSPDSAPDAQQPDPLEEPEGSRFEHGPAQALELEQLPEEPPEEPSLDAERLQTQADMQDIIALVSSMADFLPERRDDPPQQEKAPVQPERADPPPETSAEQGDEPRFLQGQRTVFGDPEELQGDLFAAPEQPQCEKQAALVDISSWFRPDETLRELRNRLDIDQLTSNRQRGYWQGVSDLATHTAWFNVQAFKDIAGRQIEKYAHNSTLAEQMISQDSRYRPFQDSVLRAMVSYFRDNGLLRNLVSANAYSLPVILTEQAGERREAWMVPFRLYPEFYTSKKEGVQRKNTNPLVKRVISIAPKDLHSSTQAGQGSVTAQGSHQ